MWRVPDHLPRERAVACAPASHRGEPALHQLPGLCRGVPGRRALRRPSLMRPETGTPHPIEAGSYRLLGERVDLSPLGPGGRAVVARVIHASADTDYARTMVVDEAAVRAGVEALAAGAPVVTDVEMVRQGITGVETVCALGEVASTPVTGPTRSARAMALAARRHPTGVVVAVGCAPTALVEVLRLAAEEGFAPALNRSEEHTSELQSPM